MGLKKKNPFEVTRLFPRVNPGVFPKLNFLGFWFGLIKDFYFIVSMLLNNKSYPIVVQSKDDLLLLTLPWVGRIVLETWASGWLGWGWMLNCAALVCLGPQLGGTAKPVSLTWSVILWSVFSAASQQGRGFSRAEFAGSLGGWGSQVTPCHSYVLLVKASRVLAQIQGVDKYMPPFIRRSFHHGWTFTIDHIFIPIYLSPWTLRC